MVEGHLGEVVGVLLVGQLVLGLRAVVSTFWSDSIFGV